MAIENTIGEAKGTRGTYRKYTNEDRFKTGKFASKNVVAACVGRFKIDFAKLDKPIVAVFKRKYEQELKTFPGEMEKKLTRFQQLRKEADHSF